MHREPVHLWSIRTKCAVIRCISSYSLPQRATYFSDCSRVITPPQSGGLTVVSSPKGCQGSL